MEGKENLPWTKSNDFEPNIIFTEIIEDDLEENDKEKYPQIIQYAQDLFSQFGSAGGGTSVPGASDGLSGKLKFGFMVHLEGWTDEVENREIFEKHMDAAFDLADVFESNGAKVTFEASPETIRANGVWDNLLLDLQKRGHGIGVHADRGYSNHPGYNLQIFTKELRVMKEDAESLGLTIQHVSGNCSELDWAKASIDAGYQFTTGGVGYCAMSMPEEIRPEQYRNCPKPALCHGNMPIGMEDRIHPWRINTALGDWTLDDPNGKLVILASDGGIKNLYEETLDSSATHGDMAYDKNDIEILLKKIDEALLLSDPSKINILYLSLSIGAADIDPVFYNSMFEALQPYVNSGQLEYKTMNEMFEEYELDNRTDQ